MAKTFNEAFKDARAAGLSEFTWEGNRYTTRLADESSSELTASERLQQAINDYEDNYNLRSIADVEYRADLDPYISGTPVSLLGFDEIVRQTDGDIGQRMKVIMGEDDPNDPDNMYDSTQLGLYSPREDERYFQEGLGEPGAAYAANIPEDFSDEFRSKYSPLRTMAHELGHKGMRVLENKNLDHFPEIGLSLEERLMDEFEGRSEANIPADAYYENNNLNRKLFDKVDYTSLNELRERGRSSIVKNKVKQVPDYLEKRKEYLSYERKSMLDKLRHFLAGKEKPVEPEYKRQKELYRYSNGGIVSLLGKD